MKIDILFFGATADLTGTRKVETTVSEPVSAGDLIAQLHAEYPDLKDRNLLFAVNEEYVSENTPLNNGDELAIFTPVSGG